MRRRMGSVAAVLLAAFFLVPMTVSAIKPLGQVEDPSYNVYWKYVDGSTKSIVGAKVELFQWNPATESWNLFGTQHTTSSGLCGWVVPKWYYYKATIWSKDDHAIDIQGLDYVTHKWDADQRYVTQNQAYTQTKTFNQQNTDYMYWIGYANFRYAHNRLETNSYNTWSCPTARVLCPHTDGPGFWPNGEEIRIPTVYDLSSKQTCYHEFGHKVDFCIPAWPFVKETLVPHYLYTEYFGLLGGAAEGAFSEGWAHFFCAWVAEDSNIYVSQWTPGVYKGIDWNGWADWADTGEDDGERVEGTVASILWDIYDGIDYSDDPVQGGTGDRYQGGFSNIWHVMYLDHAQTLIGTFNQFRTAYEARYPTDISFLNEIYGHSRVS